LGEKVKDFEAGALDSGNFHISHATGPGESAFLMQNSGCRMWNGDLRDFGFRSLDPPKSKIEIYQISIVDGPWRAEVLAKAAIQNPKSKIQNSNEGLL